MCLNLWNTTQVQLDRLDEPASVCRMLNVCTIKSRNHMKAVETMEIKALICCFKVYL